MICEQVYSTGQRQCWCADGVLSMTQVRWRKNTAVNRYRGTEDTVTAIPPGPDLTPWFLISPSVNSNNNQRYNSSNSRQHQRRCQVSQLRVKVS